MCCSFALLRYEWFLFILLLILLLLTLASSTPVAAQAAPDFTAINAYVEDQMESLHIPGLTLSIVQGDQLVHLQAFGAADSTRRPLTAQTPFMIGSVSKSFTALAAMQLVEQGKLELDAPIQRYIPWFRVADETASAQITLRHLLNQTSGLSTVAGNAYWWSDEGLEATVRRLQTVKLAQPVGEQFQYSNVNYTIAGLLVEVAGGQSYAGYVQEKIFTPLAMQHSYANQDDAMRDGLAMGHRYSFGRRIEQSGAQPPAYLPAGFLSASAEDMAHYAIAHLNGGRYGNHQLLSPQGIAELHRPQAKMQGGDFYYALGWVVEPENGLIWHNGDDARNHATILLAPERMQAVVLLANFGGFEVGAGVDEMAKSILALYNGEPLPPASPNRAIFRTIYWMTLLIPLLMLGGISWSLMRLRQWRRGNGYQLWSWFGWLRRVILPSLLNVAVGGLLLAGAPAAFGVPFSAIWLLNPDIALGILSGGILGLVWGLLWPLLVYLSLRTRSGRNPLAGQLPAGA